MTACICAEYDGKGRSTCGAVCPEHPPLITFEIDGPLMGYCASIARFKGRGYTAWKDAIRYRANTHGVPDVPSRRTRLSVTIHWTAKARIDGKNVYAAIEDALWKKDRAVGAGRWTRMEYAGREYAVVQVEELPGLDARKPKRQRHRGAQGRGE